MLDQNTDRMWYVIGAVLIGAAIILIANGSIPQIFASVTDTFEGEVKEVTERINMEVDSDTVPLHAMYLNDSGRWDISRYMSEGSMEISSDTKWGGVWFHPDRLGIQPNTSYVMEYSFEKVDGTLERVGMHADGMYEDNEGFLNGQRMPQNFVSSGDSVRVPDSNAVHDVKVIFHIGDEINTNHKIVIQPNRNVHTPFRIRLFDWTWREATAEELVEI